MEHADFDEAAFFAALSSCGARWLLIGHRALVALGIPVLTADYDFWIDSADIEKVNDAARRVELVPNRSPERARAVGGYVLEGDEHVDVLVARQVSNVDGVPLRFDDAFASSRSGV